jgi:hypothetical protein
MTGTSYRFNVLPSIPHRFHAPESIVMSPEVMFLKTVITTTRYAGNMKTGMRDVVNIPVNLRESARRFILPEQPVLHASP